MNWFRECARVMEDVKFGDEMGLFVDRQEDEGVAGRLELNNLLTGRR